MSGGRHQQSHELDFELNLAPIIDCLTVLITFTLISASFLSVSFFDAGTSGGGAPTAAAPDPVTVQINLRPDGNVDVQVSGQQNQAIRVPASETAGVRGADHAKLKTELQGISKAWPSLKGVTIAADDGVAYKHIVKAMETTRDVFPAVTLGGF